MDSIFDKHSNRIPGRFGGTHDRPGRFIAWELRSSSCLFQGLDHWKNDEDVDSHLHCCSR